MDAYIEVRAPPRQVPGNMLLQLRSFPVRAGRRLISGSEPVLCRYAHPVDIRYTKNHEWVRSTEAGDQVRVGITDYAQRALGDLVFLELPKSGSKVSRNGRIVVY